MLKFFLYLFPLIFFILHDVAGTQFFVDSTSSNMTSVDEASPKPTPILMWEPVISQAEIECMAKNIYFEAGVESTAGKLAVANVTINRKLNKSYPNTICGVVQEGIHYYNAKSEHYVPVKNRCQFSWYCDGRTDIPNEGKTWESSRALAITVLESHYDEELIDITDGAIFYHANWMKKYPSWSKQKIIMASIDRHIFYGNKRKLY